MSKNSIKIQVILSEEMDKHIREESKNLGLSMSAYVNMLMSEGLKQRKMIAGFHQLGRALALMPDEVLSKEIMKQFKGDMDDLKNLLDDEEDDQICF